MTPVTRRVWLQAALALVAGASWVRAHPRVKGVIGFIDKEGKLLFSNPDLHEAGKYSGGLALACVHVDSRPKYGFVDRTGAFKIEPRFDTASPFSEGRAFVVVRAEKRGGYIDENGKFLTDRPIESGGDFSEGLASFSEEGKIGYVDKTGKVAILPRFESAGPFREGAASATLKGKCGYISKDGSWLIEPRFEQGFPFSEGTP